jgi:hypothetical protein
MRAPIYQNATQIVISLIYLGLYTGAINTVNSTGDLDFVEVVLYIFTFGIQQGLEGRAELLRILECL